MPGASPGGGKFRFSLLLEIGPSNLNINISILTKKIQKKFFYQGRPRGVGAIFLFSLLSNIDINIFILIKKIKKNIFFSKGVPGGRGQYLHIFFISRDRTFKHKYQYFHIYQGYKKNLYISENIHRDTQLFKLVKVLVSS